MEAQAVPIQKSKGQWFSLEFRIAVRIFFCFTLFLAIIERWSRTEDLMENVSDPSNLNLEYAKEIDIETYLMTRDQLKQLYSPSVKIPLVHWEENQTGILNDRSPLYFVVRLRNHGDLCAWGRLQAHSKKWGRGSGIEERDIPVAYLPPRMEFCEDIVLTASCDINGFESIGGDEGEDPPIISMEWTSLYTSKLGGEDGR